MLFVVRKKSELYLLDRDLLVPRTPPKRLLLLDTSVLVDGRILDIAKTGFMAGVLIVPEFILKEMHILSDSEDSFRRQRGRRALDILKNIQEDVPGVEVKITGKDYLNITADEKLVKLAEELKVPLVTNDFNLNKIATVKGVSVLNINQLANALKPVVLPGETLELMIVKEGKDHEQGVGYLEDGTMVVVEDGRSYIGERKKVFVQSILQTDAGRMVFVRVKKRETVR
ncbi:MAG TPA: TRAM domain-containing protein, partial [bacterium]|nr:TRAM domain-containing protein [bacterium]